MAQRTKIGRKEDTMILQWNCRGLGNKTAKFKSCLGSAICLGSWCEAEEAITCTSRIPWFESKCQCCDWCLLRTLGPMDTEPNIKAGRTKTPADIFSGAQSSALLTPTVLRSPRQHHGGQPIVTVASPKREASALAVYKPRQWLALLEKDHEQSSPEPRSKTAEITSHAPYGRTNATFGNDWNTQASRSPSKAWRLTGPAAAPPAKPFVSVRSRDSGSQSPPKSKRGRSPGSVTPTQPQSRLWLTPERSRPVSPEIAGSPPRIKVLVASTAASPKPKRYDGFPGVPTYIGAPEVIVFTPRRSPRGAATPMSRADAVPDQGGEQAPAESSRPRRESAVDEAALIDKRGRPTFVQMWAICSVTVATLSLPFGLIILTYVFTGSGIQSGTHSTNSMPTSLRPRRAPSFVTTTDPFSGVPASCLRPVHRSANVTVVSSNYSHTGLQRSQHEIFCVLNISRLVRANYMTLIDMPLDYCTSIVYWSLAVGASGVVRSRVENFDHTDVGLYHWRNQLSKLRFQDTEIMVAVGGYAEESAYFSMLGRDPSALARFVSSLMYIVQNSSANGVVIHWLSQSPGAGDQMTKPPCPFWSTPFGARIASLALSLAAAHLADPTPSNPSADPCSIRFGSIQPLIRSLSGSAVFLEKICSGYSLASLLAEGWISQSHLVIKRFSNAISPDTGRRATASMSDVCGSVMDPPCKARGYDNCLIFRRLHQPGNASSPAPLYVFKGNNKLRDSLMKGLANPKICAVVYHLEADNFRMPCPSLNVGVFASLRRFINIAENSSNISYLEQSRLCQ
ncbi:hypothetical protein HPB49_011058 [Dermacentor silvarum]|uniref:Uncharacterized protein n=1 Tax=Dermacentor silvarum TaxID=543639 RepID=A0ACB8C343_DERSI|nr:hypothetical protein HPB49_011058 [Dermacentor silvarum]